MLEHLFLNIPTLVTDRLIIRKLAYSDKSDIFSYARNPKIATHVLWDAHLSEYETLEFLNIVYEGYNKNTSGTWGIEYKENNKIIGTVGFVSWNREINEAEIGYALSSEYWDKGIITEAVKPIIEFGFIEMELKRIVARCKPANKGSARVLEKSGFTFNGLSKKQMVIKGKEEDMLMFSYSRDDSILEKQGNRNE